jgi:hypothetical protein
MTVLNTELNEKSMMPPAPVVLRFIVLLPDEIMFRPLSEVTVINPVAEAAIVATPDVVPRSEISPLPTPTAPMLKLEMEAAVANVNAVLVFGAAPAPPPSTTEVEARSAEDAHVDAEEK